MYVYSWGENKWRRGGKVIEQSYDTEDYESFLQVYTHVKLRLALEKFLCCVTHFWRLLKDNSMCYGTNKEGLFSWTLTYVTQYNKRDMMSARFILR